MKHTETSLFFMFCFCLISGGVIGALSVQPEAEIVTIEIPVIEIVWMNKTETVIQIVEVPDPFPVYVNSTKVIYVPTPMTQNDWESKDELMTFIKADKTDRIRYSSDFDCDDFALRVIHNANDIGRRVYYFYEWRDNSNRYNNHIMCMAYVKEEALYIIFEPQTDQIWSSWSSSVGG